MIVQVGNRVLKARAKYLGYRSKTLYVYVGQTLGEGWHHLHNKRVENIYPVNLIVSKLYWCIVWAVEAAKFVYLHIVGKVTSRASNPYQIWCRAISQIWVIKPETTWCTQKLPYSGVLKKTESHIWHDSALCGVHIRSVHMANFLNGVHEGAKL